MQRTARAPALRPVRQTVALDGGPAGRLDPELGTMRDAHRKGRPMSEPYPPPPKPWETTGYRNLDVARLMRATFRQRRRLAEYYPWVPVSISRIGSPYCSSVAPYPVGALVRLWNGWNYLRGRCPECSGPVVGYSFAGGLSAGHVNGVCRRCALVVSRWIPGIGAIMAGIRPILANTPFSLTGGSVPMPDRKPVALIAVLQELGATDLPAPDSPGFQPRPIKVSGSKEGDQTEPNEATKMARSSRNQRKPRRATPGPRRYVVKEVVSTMAWTGTIWAVGCSSRESAERALKKRVARNMAEVGEPGAVMAFDREIGCLISWSDGVANPQAAVRWWFR